jgi:hypothetical protein
MVKKTGEALGVANVATLPDLAGKNMAAIMQNPYR